MTTNNIKKLCRLISARTVAARVTEDLAIATNDRVDLEKGVVECMPEQEIFALQGLVFLRHQISSRANRRPHTLPSVDSQMMTVPLNAVSPDQVHPNKSDDSYKSIYMKVIDDD